MNLEIPTENFGAKFRKKWMRSRAKLDKEAIKFCNSISRSICISNGGLGNGVTREALKEILQKYGKIECLIMPSKKSYSLASFRDFSSTENVVKNLQGFVLTNEANLASPSVNFYIHYIKEFPLGTGVDFFTPKSCLPEGLIVMEEFITTELESELVEFLKKECPSETESINSNLKHRKVWHYGYEFRYKYSDIDQQNPLPEKIPLLLEKIIAKLMETGKFQFKPDQITINKYNPGQGIPSHIDNTKAFEDSLASLSLLSQTIMDFKKDKEHIEVLLKPRSLIIFTGEARYHWTHGICPRKVDLVEVKSGTNNLRKNRTSVNRGTRFSITFRKVRSDYNGPTEE